MLGRLAHLEFIKRHIEVRGMTMRICVCIILVVAALTLDLPALGDRVMGALTLVQDKQLVAEFPVPVLPRSMMMVMTGDGEDIAGSAIVRRCEGDCPPYIVTADLMFATNSVALTAGKKAYVNSLNTKPAPSAIRASGFVRGSHISRPGDLKLYYLAGGQTIGYGALGLGYERRVTLGQGVSIEIDGGVTGVGNVDSTDSSLVNADQVLKSANGRLRFDFCRGLGFYAGYRWWEGKGESERWSTLDRRLIGEKFVAASELEEGTVRSQGIEYGFALRPSRKIEFLAGYIPAYRTDYGSVGVMNRPAYAAELRFGLGSRPIRMRATRSDKYWTADVGVSIW